MTDHIPRISVGMPVYNGEPYLAAAIEAVLSQTFTDFELIICDNASTDGTEAICRAAAERDARVRYVRNAENIGAARNYNHCFELASGEYFRWMNADDLAEPTLHERCLSTLEAYPEAVLAYGKTRLIDTDGHVTADYEDGLDLREPSPSERFRRLFRSVGLTNVIYGLMRREAVGRTGLMGDGRLPAADIRLMAELSLLGQFIEIPEPLFYRRMHSESSSADRNDDARQATFWRGSSGRTRFRLPHWRTHLGYFRTIARLDLDLREQLRVAAYVARRMVWSRADLARDLLHLFG